ncbi:MAG: GNAT family N-acetyltransferase [Rubellimicrobium sp.]|nr:GNAT family N-acetyltransferase [Rubellimicrobium sp.]
MPRFDLRLARDTDDLRAAQALRYRIFATELGARGASVDHAAALERDRFDPHCDHLLLLERDSGRLAGVTRIMDATGAARAGGFYCAEEFDLGPLLASGRKLLETGRTCLDPDFRGTTAMFLLWQGLARIVEDRGIGILFGAASFPGTDPGALAGPLAWLFAHHLAPPALRVRARGAQPGRWATPAPTDRRAAMLATPALIKAYLRLGGMVGEGAWIDRDFGTTDVCMILDATRMEAARHTIAACGARGT